MTKEEAISIISGYEVYGCGYCLQGGDEVEEALKLAIDVLGQEPVIQCKDCEHHHEAHYEEDGEKPIIKHKCKLLKGYQFSAEHYCGLAKRKEE